MFADSTEETTIKPNGASAEDVDKTVAAARSAFEGEWSTFAAAERGNFLYKLTDLIYRDHELIAAIDAFDNGKVGFSRSVLSPSPCLDVTHQRVPRHGPTLPHSRVISTSRTTSSNTTPAPPTRSWEGPSRRPLRSWHMSCRSRLACVVRLSLGKFIPSPCKASRGRAIMREAANNLKNITLECGGKSPSIIFEDADLEQAVKWSHLASSTTRARYVVERRVRFFFPGNG